MEIGLGKAFADLDGSVFLIFNVRNIPWYREKYIVCECIEKVSFLEMRKEINVASWVFFQKY